MYMLCTCIDLFFLFLLVQCMVYQLLRVQHSCSSTQSWGGVLPSVAETRDQRDRNLGSFCA